MYYLDVKLFFSWSEFDSGKFVKFKVAIIVPCLPDTCSW